MHSLTNARRFPSFPSLSVLWSDGTLKKVIFSIEGRPGPGKATNMGLPSAQGSQSLPPASGELRQAGKSLPLE